MRVALQVRRSVFFVSALIVALLAMLPMRLALDWLDPGEIGLSAREVKGSLWAGQLKDARIGRVPLGDVHAGLAPLPLAIGRARVAFAAADGAGDGPGDGVLRGRAEFRRHDLALIGTSARLPTNTMFAPLPLVAIALDDVTVRFRDGLCDGASGLVRAEYGAPIAGIAFAGGMAGNARCDNGALLVRLTSQSGMERLTLRLQSNGRYRVDLRIRASTPQAGAALMVAGFAPRGDAFTLAVEGVM